MGQTPKTQHPDKSIDLPAEQALFSSLDGLVSTFHVNERPLQGLAGKLDWYFHGAISSYLRAGAMSGKAGECAYLPLTLPDGKSGRVYHILLIGGGSSPSPGQRQPLDDRAFETLRKNILSLKIPRLGISQSDLGNATKETLSRHFKEVPVWIVQ